MGDGGVRVLFCAGCGAPLDARAWDAFVLCRYCSANNAVGSPAPSAVLDDGRPRVNVGGRTYVVEGRLARGAATDVFRGRWAMRLGELVVLKVNREARDGERVRRTVTTLEWLHEAVDPSTAGIASRLPRPIALGFDRRGQVERQVAVFQWQSGFLHDLVEVRRVWPAGVDGKVGVWILRRLLELLGYVHRAGYVHGAVFPQHVLIHPRDHGATLVGWSTATRHGQPARSLPADAPADGYPGALFPSPANVSARTDLAQAARTVSGVVAGFADPVQAFVADLGAGRGTDDAWEALDALKQATRAAYGPASYNPLPMPGW